MGLADLRVLRQQAVEQPLDEAVVAELDAAVAGLGAEAGRSCARRTSRGPHRARAAGPCPLRRHRHLARGAARRTPRRLRAAFEAEHRTRYGFIVEGRGLVVEAVTVEGIGAMEEVVEPERRCRRPAQHRSSRC